jgi:GNAT superfamily N-acetyltransferase
MHIRVARPSDLSLVDALFARSYPRLLKADYAPSVLVTALPHISRAQPSLLASGTYYVAEEGAAILGAGGWTRDRADRAKGHVRHLVVNDRYLRRGIARDLMVTSFATAREAGIKALECWATYTAEPFYSAVGFRSLGPIQVPLQPGITFPAVRMARTL